MLNAVLWIVSLEHFQLLSTFDSVRTVDLRQFSIASVSDFSVLSSAKLAVFSLFRGLDFRRRLFGWIRMFCDDEEVVCSTFCTTARFGNTYVLTVRLSGDDVVYEVPVS
ncbi:craniofacial development protein 2 [Biomphalaria glabrata]